MDVIKINRKPVDKKSLLHNILNEFQCKTWNSYPNIHTQPKRQEYVDKIDGLYSNSDPGEIESVEILISPEQLKFGEGSTNNTPRHTVVLSLKQCTQIKKAIDKG